MRRFVFFCLFIIISGTAVAQNEVIDRIAKQLADSRAQHPGMRPQVFFSQDKYAPGDTAFFRLFILTEDERILAERSLLTLELVNPSGSPILRQNVSCVKFGAANQIMLPGTLSPGVYEIRLYSDRMNIAYGLTQNLMICGEKRLEPVRSLVTTMKIFPEGGHVIAGAINRLVIRSMGQIPDESALHSDEGKITPVVFDGDGFGSVQFIPREGKSYWIEYTVGGKLFSAPVPASKPGDVTLRVYAGPRTTWVLDILSSPESPKEIYLFLVAQRQIYHAQEIQLNSAGRNQILAATDFFPQGFSELFLMDKEHRVLAYRPVYDPQQNQNSIEFVGVPKEVAIREELSTTIRLRDAAGNPVSGAFAVSVIPEATRLQPIHTPDPSVVLQANPPSVDWNQPKEHIEMELIAQAIPNRLVPLYPPLIHRTNLTLSGRAYYGDSTAMLPLLSRIIIYLHKDLIQYETAIDGRGYFQFPKIYDFFGNDWVYFKAVYLDKELSRVKVDWAINRDDYESKLDNPTYAEGEYPDEYNILRKQKLLIDKSYGYFLSTRKAMPVDTSHNAILEDEFQEADITIHPREYVPFETMQELILEVIPSLEFRKRQRDSTVRVSLITNSPFVAQRYADGNPLYIIDGWMTSNTKYLMSLSPQGIRSFKIVNNIGKLDKFGNLARNGALFIQTETPEKTKQDLAAELAVMEGMSPTLRHTSQYPESRRVPDLRTLLYWNPQIESDSTGLLKFNFRASDFPGTYWIRVAGATAAGSMITAEHSFEVKFRK